VTGAFSRSCPDLGEVQLPTLETLPEAVARNVAIARARTRARIMAVVKADGYGHGARTVAQAAVAAGAEWLGTTDIAEASELRATGLTVPILTWLNPSGVDAEAATTSPWTSRWLMAACAPCVTRRSWTTTSRSRLGLAKRRRGSPTLA
jgi:alanine racemase